MGLLQPESSTRRSSVQSDGTTTAGRPIFHFIAPKGWMNDPCAPGYDPRTGLYHLFYQWTPDHHAWKDISWGHATSPDLVNWSHNSPETPVFKPELEYDRAGIFTGCFVGTGPQGQADQLSVVYTCVNALPVHWTVEHVRGSEGLAIASSSDGGETWSKYHGNPVLVQEPDHLEVTGFRDPFIAPWPSMDKVRGVDEGETLYGLLSGGIRDKGPTAFLYAVDRKEIGRWEFLGPLVDIAPNTLLDKKWTADLGVNWECTNFLSLAHPSGLRREVLITGTEGGVERDWLVGVTPPGVTPRVSRYGAWVFGDLGVTNGKPELLMTKTGLLDHGNLYAATTFTVPDGRTLLWGWIIEEDISEEEQENKGWIGCFGILRELFLQVQDNVVGTLGGKPDDIPCFDVDAGQVVTLGIRPAAEIEKLRVETLYQGTTSNGRIVESAPGAYEIDGVFDITGDQDVALVIRHSVDKSTRTTITFSPSNETITVDRQLSNTHDGINKCEDRGPHTLFRSLVDGKEVLEKLHLRVFVDNDVVEIFANNRFALATRVYSGIQCAGISVQTKNTVERLALYRMGSIGLESEA